VVAISRGKTVNVTLKWDVMPLVGILKPGAWTSCLPLHIGWLMLTVLWVFDQGAGKARRSA
jgi:hypothetical protein